ncbi:hypothetical protein [Calothrix sp. 336/3]|uniref:hypothetical protein n=1 Tax=Calothrix sp. 336/3 TaxID=1337936 RepID=UPI00069B3635|nr:hypothetical protein [Calothrix sp. 336/3]
MPRFIAASLSFLLLVAAANNPAQAQTRHGKEVSANPNIQNNRHNSRLTAFNLVALGYQGHFKNQGISSYGAFLSDYHQMKIHSQELIKAGIAANLLPAEILNDAEYINAVERQLSAFSSEG